MGENIANYFENLMANPGVLIMLSVLLALTVFFAIVFIKDVSRSKNDLGEGTWVKAGIIGFVTDFFDTLGIGSFAPTTALLKFTNSAKDENIPGTLNISHTIPVVLEAFLFITVIDVEAKTLVLMIGAAVLGAYVGAGRVAKMDKRKIQLVMGIALAITAVIMLLQQTSLAGGSGTATGLEGWKLVVGVVGNFFLGALMTAGVGLYAPCMALVAMLGLSPAVAFPIMMGSCAFLMPTAGAKYVKENKYEKKMSFGITIGGVCGVIFAFILMQQIEFDKLLQVLTWIVIAVIIYTSITMLRSFSASKA